jgi:hypothetical protein
MPVVTVVVVGYHSGPDFCLESRATATWSRSLFEGQNLSLALALGRHTMEGEGTTQRQKRFKVRTPLAPSHTELSL